MTDSPTVYLAGPVAHAINGGADWREDLIDEFGDAYDFRNPLSKYNVPAEDLLVVAGTSSDDDSSTVGVDEIVEEDKALLEQSDGVLVGYSDVKQIGTPMEVMWARERLYPVAIWMRDAADLETLSPWYRYHATYISTDAGTALRHIEQQATGIETRPYSEVRRDE